MIGMAGFTEDPSHFSPVRDTSCDLEKVANTVPVTLSITKRGLKMAGEDLFSLAWGYACMIYQKEQDK